MVNLNSQSEGNARKKRKLVDGNEGDKPERCQICRQYVSEVLSYNGHPNNSVDEYVALTDEKLMLFTGDETHINKQDERPIHKVCSLPKLSFSY